MHAAGECMGTREERHKEWDDEIREKEVHDGRIDAPSKQAAS